MRVEALLINERNVRSEADQARIEKAMAPDPDQKQRARQHQRDTWISERR
jgi:hypothetical protein